MTNDNQLKVCKEICHVLKPIETQIEWKCRASDLVLHQYKAMNTLQSHISIEIPTLTSLACEKCPKLCLITILCAHFLNTSDI